MTIGLRSIFKLVLHSRFFKICTQKNNRKLRHCADICVILQVPLPLRRSRFKNCALCLVKIQLKISPIFDFFWDGTIVNVLL